jgi:hypothetical protein
MWPVHQIETERCIDNENYGIFLDSDITQRDVFYQATLLD